MKGKTKRKSLTAKKKSAEMFFPQRASIQCCSLFISYKNANPRRTALPLFFSSFLTASIYAEAVLRVDLLSFGIIVLNGNRLICGNREISILSNYFFLINDCGLI